MSDPQPPPPPSTTSSNTTFLSSTYLSSIPPDSTADLQSFLDAQAKLEDEAREVMPFKTGECSWERGYVKQAVWACRDCGGKGICYGCSISCHAEHDLVELFQRRLFRCDCPTTTTPTNASSSSSSSSTANSTRCTLNPEPRPKNDENKYTKNFSGSFCRCVKGETYDPMEEEESMISCLGCEDWFHEGCLNLYDPEKPPPMDEDEDDLDEPLPTASSTTTAITSTSITASANQVEIALQPASTSDDTQNPAAAAAAAAATAPLPQASPSTNPSLLSPNSYAHLICAGCVKRLAILKRLAGTKGWGMIVARQTSPLGSFDGAEGMGQAEGEGKGVEQWADRWEVVGKEDEIGGKRKAEQMDDDEPSDKRTKVDGDGSHVTQASTSRCGLPPINPRAQAVFDDMEGRLGKGDIFLTQGRREQLRNLLDCPCPECTGFKSDTPPFPLSEEDEGEVYEPPRDEEEDETEETMEEMTARTLNHLPRSQAIETMIKFNEMKDQLKLFLEGFRGGDKVVKEEDIRAFVEGMREQAEKR